MDFFRQVFISQIDKYFGIFMINFVRKIFFTSNTLVFVLIWRVQAGCVYLGVCFSALLHSASAKSALP